MNNKYKWDKKEILKKYMNLKKQKLTFEDEIINNHYMEALMELLKYNKYESLINKYPYLLLTKKKLKEEADYFFNDEITNFQKDAIVNNLDIILDYQNEEENDILTNKIDIKDQINLIKEYFSINDKLINKHEELFNKENNFLNITKKYVSDFFCGSYNDGYITNKNNNNVYGFLALCHEVGHFDEFFTSGEEINKKILIDGEKINNYDEISSIFYELISIDILKENNYISEKEANALYSETLEINTKNIVYLDIFKDIYDGKNDKSSKYIHFLETDISNISIYYYSYLVATSLFEDYLIDRDKAFYNLNYINNNITQDNEYNVLKYCDIDLHNIDKVKNHINRIKKKND